MFFNDWQDHDHKVCVDGTSPNVFCLTEKLNNGIKLYDLGYMEQDGYNKFQCDMVRPKCEERLAVRSKVKPQKDEKVEQEEKSGCDCGVKGIFCDHE